MSDDSQQNSTLSGLTPTQVKVTLALAEGASLTTAAKLAGIHRSTIYYWLDHDPRFVDAIQQATDDYVVTLRDRLKDLSIKSLNTVESLMEDTKTPATVRLRAALAVLTRPRSPKQEWALDNKLEFRRPEDEPIRLVWRDPTRIKPDVEVARESAPAKAA